MTDTQPFMDEARGLVENYGSDPEGLLVGAISAALSSAYQRGREEGREDLEDVLCRVKQWCDAYPLDVFPEPDFKRASELLKAGGITLDAVSASCMRHVCTGISKIIAVTAIRTQRDKG